MTYGVFKDILSLEQQHGTSDVVFCWDSGKKGLRHDLLPSYKEKRHNQKLTDEQLDAIKDLRRQMSLLRDFYLPYIGYTNIYHKRGYEADDMIASTIHNLPKHDQAIIVSADKDLFQLLRPNVVMWNPTSKKVYTHEAFHDEFGVPATLWAEIKAIAGCSTDQVVGVKGVGEKTAAKYLKFLTEGAASGPMAKGISKAWGNIRDFTTSGQIDINRQLVRLPFKGCPKIVPEPQEVRKDKWVKLCKRLGMKRLVGQVPGRKQGFGILPVRVRKV